MRLSKTWIVFAVALSLAASFSAQELYTPEKGSKERKEILSLLRAPVEKELKQDIVFEITDLNVFGEWAFLGGFPKRPDGSWPDYKGTKFQRGADDTLYDKDIFALFKRAAGKWKLVTYELGCTDPCTVLWWKKYNAPKEVFPYTEDPSE